MGMVSLELIVKQRRIFGIDYYDAEIHDDRLVEGFIIFKAWDFNKWKLIKNARKYGKQYLRKEKDGKKSKIYSEKIRLYEDTPRPFLGR